MAKILLVEDDKSLREIYGVRLMAEGYEIVSAGDGEEALAMAIKERPDLIVSDVMMPKISGFDMLDILRSTSETKDVKVIMMTALSSDDQRARGESLGADRYLVKSQVGIEDVVRTVHDVLGDSIAAPTPAAPTFPASFTPSPAPAVDQAPQPAPAPAPAPVAAAPAYEAPQPAPAVDPVYAQPAPEPQVAPVAAPEVVAAPAYEQPVAPAPQVAPVPEPAAPAPVAPATQPTAPVAFEQPAPVAPQQFAAPAPTPAPAFTQPVAPAPIAAPAYEAPQPAPVPSEPLPQPTAPFSSPAPASLGERVIEPLTNPSVQQNDIASQMAAALNTQPPQQPPQVPPAQ